MSHLTSIESIKISDARWHKRIQIHTNSGLRHPKNAAEREDVIRAVIITE